MGYVMSSLAPAADFDIRLYRLYEFLGKSVVD